MPTWLPPFLVGLARTAPVCFAGLLLLSLAGYYFSTSTFARAETVAEQAAKFENGIDLILIRLDVSDAEGKLREIGSSIRTKEAQLADMMTVLDGMDPSSNAAAILRENIRELNLDLGDLRRQETNDNASLLRAKQSMAQVGTRGSP